MEAAVEAAVGAAVEAAAEAVVEVAAVAAVRKHAHFCCGQLCDRLLF